MDGGSSVIECLSRFAMFSACEGARAAVKYVYNSTCQGTDWCLMVALVRGCCWRRRYIIRADGR